MEPWKLQPARDTGLTPSERLRSIRRESGLLERLAHHLSFSILRMYLATAHRLQIIGRQHLPAHGPFILAANHCSHLDAVTLVAAFRPRHRERAFPIAAGDVFFQTKAVSVFSAIGLNALPMWRKNCGPHALADLRRKLEEEKCIFPRARAVAMAAWPRLSTVSECWLPKRGCQSCLRSSRGHSKHCRPTGKFRVPHESKSSLARHWILQLPQPIARAGRRSRRAWNLQSAILAINRALCRPRVSAPDQEGRGQ